MRKNLILWMGVVMLLLVGCSSDDDANFGSGGSDLVANSPRALYAIVKPEEAQLIDIIPYRRIRVTMFAVANGMIY